MAEFHEIGSSQFTEVTPTGSEQIQISATQKTTLQKIANLFKAMTAVLTGFTPLGKGAPTISQTSTILQAFQSLYQLVGGARTKILGTNGTTVGFVSWTDNLAYGILFDVEQEKIYIRNGWTATNPSNNTDDQWITAIRAGKALSMGGGSLSDFTPISVMPDTGFGGLEITQSDTISTAISKISYLLGNSRVKVLGNGVDYPHNVGMIVADDNGNFNGFVLDTGDTNNYLYMCYAISQSNIHGLSDKSIVDWISENYDSLYDLNMLNNSYGKAANFMNIQSPAISMGGTYCVYYIGTNKSPTVTLLSSNWSKEAYFATLVVDYDVNPTFGKQSSSDVIHMHQNASEVAPTSGKKVYSIFCQISSNVRHFFINVAPYN